MQKKHPESAPTQGFCCEKCQKTFSYEMAFQLHQEHCGKEKAKPFKCTICEKCFTRKATLEDHQKKAHQIGGAVKRKSEGEEGNEKKKIKLPEKMDEVLPVDKEVSAMKGAKVDAFFHPKTETQQKDQQIFFKETLPRLQVHLQKVLTEKKAVKWNLMYHCTLEMPDKYRSENITYEGYFRTPHPITSTYPQQLFEQLNAALESECPPLCKRVLAGPCKRTMR